MQQNQQANAKTLDATRPKEATGQAESSPSPSWSTNGCFVWITDDRKRINREGETLAFLPRVQTDDSSKVTAERCELICRAVNHHEELLQALKALLASGDDLAIRLLKENSIFVTESYAVATENGYAAIANAEKGNDNDTKD